MMEEEALPAWASPKQGESQDGGSSFAWVWFGFVLFHFYHEVDSEEGKHQSWEQGPKYCFSATLHWSLRLQALKARNYAFLATSIAPSSSWTVLEKSKQ